MVIGAAADGYSTMNDQYGGYMYVLGKSKSATTVSAPGAGVQLGQSVVVTGTVTDLSAAQPGAACVSEASMGAYMSYLHLQSQLQNMLHPEAPTGVPVSIDAIGPRRQLCTHRRHNKRHKQCLTAQHGNQPAEGKWIITATFAGSPSYGSSLAETAIVVDPAPATATPLPTQSATVLPPYDLYIIAGVIAMIIALAIATIIIIRKK